MNLYKCNYQNFNEREFNETLHNMNWNDILSLDENDPNISMNNLHHHINSLLDEFAPYRKLSKREYKFKSKLWVNLEILLKMKEIYYNISIVNQHTNIQLLHKLFMRSIRLSEIN